MATINIDGQDFPVTDGWHAAVIEPYPELATWGHDQLEAERTRLLEKSNVTLTAIGQAAPTWTPADAARLAAVTHVINAHRATRFLGGRSHEDFGFDGVDQVHGNRYTAPCGCELHHIFDHHIAVSEDRSDLVVHPHYPRFVCDDHVPENTLALALAGKPYDADTLADLHAAVIAHANAVAEEAAPPAEG